MEVTGLITKLLMAVTILWSLYEVRQLDLMIKYPRLNNFLKEIEQAIIIYLGLRVVSAFIEYIFHFTTGWFSIAVSAIFFILLSIRIRFRRQRLANEWNAVPEKHNGELFTQIATDLKDTTKELTKLT